MGKGFITAKNGRAAVGQTDMDYAVFGRGDKVLAVLPGLSDGLATVRGKALFLSAPYRKYLRDYTVYMFSRRNHLVPGCTMEDMADDQAEAMRGLGLSGASVLGVSQGGMIAQALAVRHPDMVSALVLAVTAPFANETVRAVVSGWMEMARRSDHAALMADTAEKMYSEAYLRKYRPLLPLLARFTKPHDYNRFMVNAQAILAFDARDCLSRIHCPTLILAGSEDHTVGTLAAMELHSCIPGSELFVYEGLGHGAYEEARDFYDRVFSFCSR